MKPLLKLLLCTLFFCQAIAGQTQTNGGTKKWLCDKGFWVIENNESSPKNCTIYFYTNERELVYKELVTGKRINTEKLKTRKHLDAVLNVAVTAWQKEKVVKENLQMVVAK